MNFTMQRLPLALRHLLLAAGLLAGGAAAAAVGPAATLDDNGLGSMSDIPYSSGGNVFQLLPLLFVQGLGSADKPDSVVTLNPSLSYAYSVSGAGSSQMTIDYRIRNVSVNDSFNQLRFAVFINPDGNSVNFLDTLAETWGAAAPGDPDRREGRGFVDPSDTIVSSYQLNNNLTDGLRSECLAGNGGCDATAALQWNAATLGPGQTFLIRVGLADDGSHLSSRFLEVHDTLNPKVVLTFSGVASVVPLPGTAVLFAPLALVLAGLRRRATTTG